jgi:hypothetical protein
MSIAPSALRRAQTCLVHNVGCRAGQGAIQKQARNLFGIIAFLQKQAGVELHVMQGSK